MKLSDDQLAALRQLAERATPGPWEAHAHPFNEIIDGELSTLYSIWVVPGPLPMVTSASKEALIANKETAEFIAAFNPETAKALLDELEASRAVVQAAIAWNATYSLPGFDEEEQSMARIDLSEAVDALARYRGDEKDGE